MLPIAQNQTQWRWQYGDVRKLIEKNALKEKPLQEKPSQWSPLYSKRSYNFGKNPFLNSTTHRQLTKNTFHYTRMSRVFNYMDFLHRWYTCNEHFTNSKNLLKIFFKTTMYVICQSSFNLITKNIPCKSSVDSHLQGQWFESTITETLKETHTLFLSWFHSFSNVLSHSISCIFIFFWLGHHMSHLPIEKAFLWNLILRHSINWSGIDDSNRSKN